MKKLLIVGATGNVGRRLTEYALEEGYQVSAAARSPDSLNIQHANLQRIPLDALDAQAVFAALDGHDCVISALGAVRGSGLEVLHQGMANLVAAGKKSGINRLIGIAGAGLLQFDVDHQLREMPFFPDFLRPISAAHYQSYSHLSQSGLTWTMICPPMMKAGERSGRYLHQAEFVLADAKNISFEDVADLILRDLVEKRYLNCRVAISY